MSARIRRVVLVAALAALAAPATAQTPQPPPAAPAEPTAAPPDGPPSPPPNYSYSPDGRRDPFVGLLNRGVGDGRSATATRPAGPAGLLVDEIVVRGVIRTTDGFVAMIAGPNGRSYTVRPGDRLLDGRIRAITPEALIILQEVNDPLSLEKQREVRKRLRDGGGEVH
ncbi:MAG: hypothetical protein AB7O67_13430 [Vicinamibacterales bacterium]